MQRISITNPQNIIDGTAKKYYFKLRNTGGPKGDKGDKGDTGATGAQGPQGDPCTVVVNSTATLEPGSNAYVTNTGSLSNAVLDFGIPKGDRGPQGAKGDKGDTGAQGETGPRGPQGEKGTNATVYVGTTSTLAPGSQATVYNSGSDSNAVLNFGIPQGAKGDTGSQGPQGPTGPAGQNFAPTVVAELPATGDSSKLYLTPKAHTTQTATGNPITTSVTEQAGALESFQLDGDTFQQSYTGKNLFGSQLVQGYYAFANGNYSSNSNAYVTNKDKISVSAGATYTISANKGVYEGSDYTGAGVVFFNNGTYVSSILRPENGTFTVPSGANQVVYNFYKGSSDENITPSDIKWVQLESGSSASSFEPYVGGTPSPNPDYPQTIQTVTGEQTVEIVGKNLLDKNNMDIRNGYLYNTTFSYRTTNADKTFIVPCEPNTTYTISRSVITSSFRAAYIDLGPSEIPADASSETSLTCAGYIANNSGTSITITTSATAKSLLVHYGNTNTDGVTLIDQSVATIMVEKSASATAYAPYSHQTLPLDLGTIELCQLGTYQDYIYKDGDSWKLHKATGQVTLNGTEDWYASQSSIKVLWINNPDHTGLGINDIYSGYTRDSLNGQAYMTCAVRQTVGNILNASKFGFGVRTENDGGSLSNAANALYVGFEQYTTVDAVKQYFASNNAVLYYQLNEATDTIITNTNLVAQLEAIRTASLENGTNTITNSTPAPNLAGDMEIGYYGYNPTNRYDKFIWLNINNNYEQIGS